MLKQIKYSEIKLSLLLKREFLGKCNYDFQKSFFLNGTFLLPALMNWKKVFGKTELVITQVYIHINY